MKTVTGLTFEYCCCCVCCGSGIFCVDISVDAVCKCLVYRSTTNHDGYFVTDSVSLPPETEPAGDPVNVLTAE